LFDVLPVPGTSVALFDKGEVAQHDAEVWHGGCASVAGKRGSTVLAAAGGVHECVEFGERAHGFGRQRVVGVLESRGRNVVQAGQQLHERVKVAHASRAARRARQSGAPWPRAA
jgi:hypothetical protein